MNWKRLVYKVNVTVRSWFFCVPLIKTFLAFNSMSLFKKLALGLVGFIFFIVLHSSSFFFFLDLVLHSSIPFEKQSLSFDKTTFEVCARLSVLVFFFSFCCHFPSLMWKVARLPPRIKSNGCISFF